MVFSVSPSPNFGRLPTEQNNPASRRIDELSIPQTLRLINKADSKVPQTVLNATPALGLAVQLVVESLKNKGHLFLIGAGTSGRLAVMEAAECPPTFNTSSSMIQAMMAGGRASVFKSKEGAEDKGHMAAQLVRKKVRPPDVVVGIAASGVTAFVREGLRAARSRKAKTILITCFPGAPKNMADVVVRLKTGPEIIAGSTRLKAATATKLALNALTVTSMIQLGKVYKNWMVDLQPKSKKLKARAIRLIQNLGGVSQNKAKSLLQKSGGNAKTAILMARRKISKKVAQKYLKRAKGHLHMALKDIDNLI
jgi:N-acetylmuramic acid 6-phosphate etherase